MWTTIALVATLIAFIFYRATQRPQGFPPGPLCLPLIGTMLSLTPSPKEAFQRFTKKYGDVVSINVFGEWRVMINDSGLVRSGLADGKFAGRPLLYLFTARNEVISGKRKPLGIIGTNGDIWKHQRRFSLRTLRDQGFGRNTIEPVMKTELEELGDFFAQKGNQKFEVGASFNRSVVNVIWAMVVGKRFSYNDDRLQELVVKVTKMLQTFDPFSLMLNNRVIKKLFPYLDIYKKCDGYVKDLVDFIEDQIENYIKEQDGADDPGSYLGVFLREIKGLDLDDEDDPNFNMHHLKANIFELFLAGSETTSATLCWAFYLMATHTHIQKKIQQEMDAVIGKGNAPSFEHIDRLPYTTAAIYEIQRKADLLPFSVPHMATEDVTISGYNIPKGTTVLFNLSHGHRCPKYWKNPESFDPEHFLTPEGKVRKPDNFIPFGYGKRVCLGESLARQELFHFFTTLVHRFNWELSDDPVTWEKAAVLNRPPNYSVIVSERNKDHKAARPTSAA